MNLAAIVGPVVDVVNPAAAGSLQVSTGSTLAADGTPVPSYATAVPITVRSQALQYKDLVQVEGLNLNGTRRAFYLLGQVEGVNRAESKGGDLITLTAGPLAGSVWLVALVLEAWGDAAATERWVKVAVTQQQASGT